MDWFNQVRDMEKWPASVDMVMYLWVPQNTANFLTTE